MCMWERVVHTSAGAHRNRKRAFGFLELKLQAVVNYLMCVLVTELGSSQRTAESAPQLFGKVL